LNVVDLGVPVGKDVGAGVVVFPAQLEVARGRQVRLEVNLGLATRQAVESAAGIPLAVL
jgi:hypothetical protein